VISAVLDTNVLASGFIGLERPESVPGELIRRWGDAVFTLVVSEHILIELDRTFADRYFSRRMSAARIEAVIQGLREDAIVHQITARVRGVATQPKDDLVLATAISAGAAYLVTGDHPLQSIGQYEGVAILSPRRFLDVLESAG
jgi:putative PIN family toxin of toxin-antitoxin system